MYKKNFLTARRQPWHLSNVTEGSSAACHQPKNLFEESDSFRGRRLRGKLLNARLSPWAAAGG